MQEMAKIIGRKMRYQPEYILCLTKEEFRDYFKKGKLPNKKLLAERFLNSAIIFNQKKYLRIAKFDTEEKELLKLVSKVVWVKPRRKDYQSKSYFHIEKFFRELARRLNISLREAI